MTGNPVDVRRCPHCDRNLELHCRPPLNRPYRCTWRKCRFCGYLVDLRTGHHHQPPRSEHA